MTKHTIPAAAAGVAILSLTLLTRAWAGPAADAVAKLAPEDAVSGPATMSELVKLGPAGLAELCSLILAPGQGDDSKARYALHGLVLHVGRPGAEAERALVATALVAALEATQDGNVKAFLLQQLQYAGADEAVPALAAYLTNDALCDPAARALVAIRTPQATAALLQAYPAAAGAARLSLVAAVDELRLPAAAPALLQDAAAADPTLRWAALHAVANLPVTGAADLLAQAAQSQTAYDRARGTSQRLLFARRLIQTEAKDAGVAILRDLLKTRTENNVRTAALAGLIDGLGQNALPDLLAAVDSPDRTLRWGVLRLSAALTDPAVTAAWIGRLTGVGPEVKADIVTMLGERGDKQALPTLIQAIQDPEAAVRLAALPAAVRLGGQDAVGPVLAAMATDRDDDLRVAKEALLRVPGDLVLTAAAENLGKVSVKGRVALLDLLATRRARACTPAVLAATHDADPAVRVAALDALRSLAAAEHLPQLVDLMTAATTPDERAAAQKTVVAVARTLPDAATRADALLARLGAATGDTRAVLLQALARLGGAKALDAVLADTRSPDAPTRDAAVRALAEWPDAAAADALLDLAKTSDQVPHHVLALRGFIRVTAASDLAPEQKAARLAEAMATAKRPDEKKQALSALGDVRNLAALRTVTATLADDALRTEALQATVRIACPRSPDDKGMIEPAAVPLLRAALQVADPDTRKKLEEHLSGIPLPDEKNLALGKPVTASCPQQGDKAPEKAVDGNSTDRNSAWFGAAWPSWIQVDLQAPVKLGNAHVFFYWDGTRYYPYTLDVSADGKAWQTVVDNSGNTTPATAKGVLHTFAPVEARYARLNILKNSVNEAVHLVELKLYAEGAGPTPFEVPKPDAEGFIPLFNGRDLTGWNGSVDGYVPQDGVLVCDKDKGGTILTDEEFADFVVRFEFKLTPGANNGLAIRAPASGNPAYEGMEIQILDDTAEVYKDLKPYQYHGSVYGVAPCEKGHQKPVGEWNEEEVTAEGSRVVVKLNGAVIVDVDLVKASTPQTMDGQAHPGLQRERGRVGFMGHGANVELRNIRIKVLKK